MKLFVNACRVLAFLGLFSLGAGVALAADTVPPVVGALTPTTVSGGTYTTFSATYSDDTAVSRCQLIVDGSTSVGNMALGGGSTSGTASIGYTFNTSGAHTAQAQCVDTSGNWGYGPSTAITVAAGGTVSAVRPTTAVLNVPVNLSADFSGFASPFTASGCWLVVDGSTVYPSMTLSGTSSTGVATRSYTFTSTGSHPVFVSCLENGMGTYRAGTTTNILVNATSTDTTAPVVGTVAQTSATTGVGTTLSATYSDNVGVTACHLFVNGTDQGASALSSGTTSRSFTFASAGTYTAYMQCQDAAGNITSGPSQTITVSDLTPPPGMPAYGSLIKLTCPAGAGVNDPCKAVYYFARDNKRHAFPNEKVYFTWYGSFAGVVDVSSAMMASITLGSNVTYRPGIRMVKFTTVPRVYAVTRAGFLRWVGTEALATSLYGSNWNTKIDDISDAFFSNYSFGADINTPADYNPAGESAAVTTIDQNL